MSFAKNWTDDVYGNNTDSVDVYPASNSEGKNTTDETREKDTDNQENEASTVADDLRDYDQIVSAICDNSGHGAPIKSEDTKVTNDFPESSVYLTKHRNANENYWNESDSFAGKNTGLSMDLDSHNDVFFGEDSETNDFPMSSSLVYELDCCRITTKDEDCFSYLSGVTCNSVIDHPEPNDGNDDNKIYKSDNTAGSGNTSNTTSSQVISESGRITRNEIKSPIDSYNTTDRTEDLGESVDETKESVVNNDSLNNLSDDGDTKLISVMHYNSSKLT